MDAESNKFSLNSGTNAVPLAAIEEAAQRIKPFVRRTPFIRARQLRHPIRDGELLLKLENLQVTGAFKVRGAVNAALLLEPERRAKGLVAASGGNHGIATAFAAHTVNAPAHIFMPHRALPEKVEQVRRWGGSVEVVGDTWDDAHDAALDFAGKRDLTYIHPFADESVMAGQGTIGLEMMNQSSHCEHFVLSIGGGGLISGVASALKQSKSGVRVYGVEPVGAPTLTRSLERGEVTRLASIDTAAITLAPRRSDPATYEIVRDLVDEIVLVSDAEMTEAAQWLWYEFGLSVELSGAASVAAVMFGHVKVPNDQSVGVIVCGAGTDSLNGR